MDDYDNLDSYFGGGLSAPNPIPVGSVYSMNNGSGQMNSGFTSQGNFPSTNDDLNSFFTPGLNGPSKAMLAFGNGNEMMGQGQWDNVEAMQMFDQQQFPFPIQPHPMKQQMPEDSNAGMGMTWNREQNTTTSIEKENLAPSSGQQIDDYDEIEKPKRGRPRKRKRKHALSEQEQQRKREAFLERNRRAASKCRQRKKESTEQIQARVSNLDKESRMLTTELMLLQADYAQLLNTVLEHAKACPENGIFQATLDAAARGRMPLSGEKAMDWDALTRNTAIDVGQTSMLESTSPREGGHLSYTETGSSPSQQRAMAQRLGFLFDQSEVDQTILRTDSLQQGSEDGAQIKSRSNSIGSSGSSTVTRQSSNKDSGYDTNAATTPSPRKIDSPDFGTVNAQTMLSSLKSESNDEDQRVAKFAKTLRSGTVIAAPTSST